MKSACDRSGVVVWSSALRMDECLPTILAFIWPRTCAYRGHVRVEVVGIAASIASIIAMAGDEIAMASNSFLMVHRSWGVTVGNEADHVEQASVLSKIDKALAGTYATRTGKAAAEMHRLMNAETWLTAREAKAGGFADEVLGDLPVAAKFDLGTYAKAPEALRAPVGPIQIQSRLELERLLRDGGLSKAATKKAVGLRSPALGSGGLTG